MTLNLSKYDGKNHLGHETNQNRYRTVQRVTPETAY